MALIRFIRSVYWNTTHLARVRCGERGTPYVLALPLAFVAWYLNPWRWRRSYRRLAVAQAAIDQHGYMTDAAFNAADSDVAWAGVVENDQRIGGHGIELEAADE